MELLDWVLSALSDKKLPVSIFMDLSKAFDTLDHKILQNKLQYYGTNGTPYCWFMSYLSGRTECVEINHVISSRSSISTGVPQGSILGSLLFLIYMNDLPCASNLFHLILYADDTTLLSTIGYSIALQNSNVNDQLNRELLQVYGWLVVKKLSLNVNKTKFMVFHPCEKDISQLTPTLKINNMEIEKISDFNFLGVILDEWFTWKTHIDKLASKLSRNACILNKLKNFLSALIMKTLYHSLSHSNLNCRILIWGYKCNRLVKLQKRLIRIVMLAKCNAHTDPLFKQAAILKISDMHRVNALNFHYKHQHRKLPNYFYNFNLTTQGSHNSYALVSKLGPTGPELNSVTIE